MRVHDKANGELETKHVFGAERHAQVLLHTFRMLPIMNPSILSTKKTRKSNDIGCVRICAIFERTSATNDNCLCVDHVVNRVL